MYSDSDDISIRSGRTVGASWYKKLNRIFVTMDCVAEGIRSKEQAIERAKKATKNWPEWKLESTHRMKHPGKTLALVVGEVHAESDS